MAESPQVIESSLGPISPALGLYEKVSVHLQVCLFMGWSDVHHFVNLCSFLC